MRLRTVLLTACSTLALASCGGETQQQAERTTTTAAGPSIPADVAQQLAARSDKVAAHLDAGDHCAARTEALKLRAEVTKHVDEIPQLYLEDLSGLVNEIEVQIPVCAQVPPPIKSEGKNGKGKGKGKKKGKKWEDEGDDD